MTTDGGPVTVRWHEATTDADEALRVHVAEVAGVEPATVEVGRLCGRCGSSDHGRPWAGHGVHVSLARSGPHLVTAVSTTGPVGVDVESETAVDRAWPDLTPLAGPPPAGVGRAAWWCRLEAVLKRDGIGFADGVDGGHVDEELVDDLAAPTGYRAAIAVTSR